MSVGSTWVNMMLEIASTESEETLACSGKELLDYNAKQDEDQGTEEKGFSECLDSTFGSIEGFGEKGVQQSSENREARLELQVGELEDQVGGRNIYLNNLMFLKYICEN